MTPAPEFWTTYHRQRGVNYAAAVFCLRDCERLLARSNDPAVAGTLRRVRAALDDYDALQKSLTNRVTSMSAQREAA